MSLHLMSVQWNLRHHCIIQFLSRSQHRRLSSLQLHLQDRAVKRTSRLIRSVLPEFVGRGTQTLSPTRVTAARERIEPEGRRPETQMSVIPSH
jgi:hypothetical protein